jgi:acetyl esterase/lipase
MPSLKSRIILKFLANRHLMKFKMKRPVFDGSLEAIRRLRKETEDTGLKFGKIPREILIEPVKIRDMYAEWVQIPGPVTGKVILYFHGGMYLVGSPLSHRVHVAKFVQGSGLDALVFDYRLAPEYQFPAALEDALTAYNYLLKKGFLPENIVFAGDSAGAGLCLATLLAIKKYEKPLPAAAAVLSPWTDLTLSGESYKMNMNKCLSPLGSSETASALYAGTQSRTNPLISPLFGDLEGLPPLHISVGSDEILLDDSRLFAEKAKAAGVDVTLLVGDGMCHCYPAFGNLMAESKAALGEICAFLKNHAGKNLNASQ